MRRLGQPLAASLGLLLLAGSAAEAATDRGGPGGPPAGWGEAAGIRLAQEGGQPQGGWMGGPPGQMRQQMQEMMEEFLGGMPGMMRRGAADEAAGEGMPGMGMRGMPGMMGMMGRMGPHGHGPMLRMFFALMDADGDGTVSREEFLEAQERIFNHMDADGDGALTLEEVRAFLVGPGWAMPAPTETEAEPAPEDEAEAE